MTTSKTSSGKSKIDWNQLERFSSRLSQVGMQPGAIEENEWQIIEYSLNTMVDKNNWQEIIRLRDVFSALYARDTMTGLVALQRLDQQAIQAARQLEDSSELGHLLGAKGHNLHRQGYHQEAINIFEESAFHYQEANRTVDATKSYYMTSLCHRALGRRKEAKQVLETVLKQIDSEDLWRANPLQVMAWITQDEGDLSAADQLLRQALGLYRQMSNSDLLVVGVLADLGEIGDIHGNTEEARQFFEESLMILEKHYGQYDRQEARTLLKYSEFLIHQRDYVTAMKLLNRADDKAGRYGHYYDLLWQIELAKALIYLLEKNPKYCFNKIRSVFRIRKILKLSNLVLVQHVIKRFAKRVFS